MKTTRYRFEAAIQAVSSDKQEWLKDEFKSILESDKDFTRKADYIGFSIANIDAKVASIDEEIKELQQLKKSLKSAKAIALNIGAEIFEEYGIDKIEGAGISSITVTPASSKTKVSFTITDEEALIKEGFYKVIFDEDAIMKAFHSMDEKSRVDKYCIFTTEDIATPAKLKVNRRRTANSSKAIEPLKDVS